ncbi:MAG TPA: ABC transporter permease subunit [Candidatus Dormibacteraeota bacterium]|nr:ABC transporter permease subunit [Candidatus Dormibacteraeota bacterium]
MNAVIAGITLRQLLSRRRTLLLLLLGGVLVLVALIVRLAGEESRALPVTAGLLATLGVATLMPLVALLFGTGAIGSELEDGTAVYLLAKPIRRSTILLTKLAVASACAILLTCGPMLLAGLIGAGDLGDGLVLGFVAAAAIGSILYSALFVSLSLATRRALVFGLGYVLIWEGVLSGLFPGTRTFSVRQITLAFADAFAGVPPEVFDAQLELTTAVVMAGIVLVAATALAIRRLVGIEIAGETA